jgi:flagellar basal body rod protein FlgC
MGASGKDSASSALTLSSTSEKGDIGGEAVAKASLPVAIVSNNIKFAKTSKETEEGYRRSVPNSYEREAEIAAIGRATPLGHGSGYSGVGSFHYSSSPSVLHLAPSHPAHIPHQPHHHASKPPRNLENKGIKRDYVYDKKEAMRQFVRKFRARYEVNPFRKEDGSGFLQTRTHNRRRWSHIFPSGGSWRLISCVSLCVFDGSALF